MRSSNYELVRQAIAQRMQLVARAKGGRRELCPHALGLNGDGDEQALFYQFAGYSGSGLSSDLRENWRCFALADLEGVELRSGPWHTAGNHGEGQSCVRVVHFEVGG